MDKRKRGKRTQDLQNITHKTKDRVYTLVVWKYESCYAT